MWSKQLSYHLPIEFSEVLVSLIYKERNLQSLLLSFRLDGLLLYISWAEFFLVCVVQINVLSAWVAVLLHSSQINCENSLYVGLQIHKQLYIYNANIATPWSRVLHVKLTVTQLIKKFPTFYGTRKFIAVFTWAHHWSLSWARWFQSTPSHPVYLKIHSNVTLPPMPRSFE
jgi:hypothetical protein